MMSVYKQVLCFVQYLVEKIGLLRRLGNSVSMTAILLATDIPEGSGTVCGRPILLKNTNKSWT